ncbi:MAG: hypothetical protein Q4F17_06265 [Eubacteriales bacterium]|nr:hypothetical protein [Eubacteriales bacterium]
MNSKKWGVCLLVLSVLSLGLLGAVTAYIDPFFHYHGPLDFLQYPIDDQRYQNDGIVRHFDYDAVITGTSLTENFRASQFDRLFGVNAVKVCFSGGTYHELNSNLRRALEAKPGIRLVLFGIDSWFLRETPGALRTDAVYPAYLYDDKLCNDVSYLLNKEVLCSRTAGVLEYTRMGRTTTDFDEYSFWGSGSYGVTGREVALANFPRESLTRIDGPLSQQERQQIVDNLTNGAVEIARAYPDTQFLYFFPPYSILYWDSQHQEGSIDRQTEAWSLASEVLLAEPNIRLFSFYDDFETVTNLDNYRDNVHYGDAINALLLDRMARGEGELTLDNYRDHWKTVADFYRSYDYDAIFE